jgi:thiamine-monophosphate kinase
MSCHSRGSWRIDRIAFFFSHRACGARCAIDDTAGGRNSFETEGGGRGGVEGWPGGRDGLRNQDDMDEFRWIDILRQKGTEALGVQVGIGDDAAVLAPSLYPLVTACDTLVENVHFRRDTTTAYQLGRKLVAVNVSDFAAMGVQPQYALLSMSFPKSIDVDWFHGFAEGLMSEMKRWSVGLVGGDTTASPEGISLTVTLLGYAETAPLLRSGGRAGEPLYVTGTLGDSALGLYLSQHSHDINVHSQFLMERHRVPEPRLAWGRLLAQEQLATACQDISDGLLQDVAHIAQASGCAAKVFLEQIPRSHAFRHISESLSLESPSLMAATGGEDFELVFSTSPERSIPQELEGISVSSVGCLCEGVPGDVICLDSAGEVVEVKRRGWRHF